MKRPVVLAGLLLAVLSLPALAARSNVTDPDLPRALPSNLGDIAPVAASGDSSASTPLRSRRLASSTSSGIDGVSRSAPSAQASP